MDISAQVSVYPLRQASIGPTIRQAVSAMREHGVHMRMGEMSSLVWGEERAVFDALRDAFRCAAESGDAVMVVTLSNACPAPGES